MDILKSLDYDKEVLQTALKVALLNAVKHEGVARQGSVISAVLGSHPEVKKDMKNFGKISALIVKKINELNLTSQEEMLLKIDPAALDKKERDENIFKFMNINEKVVSVFPPGPEKYPHIGHAKALILNYLLAKTYNGKFYLRFDDTNPGLVKKEFYEAMITDFSWLGVKWDEIIYASDHIALYYKHCVELINKGLAYVSSASSEKFKEYKDKGISPIEYEQSPKENLELWEKMKSQNDGEAVVRLKIDINHKNSTMRDPIIFRIISQSHAKQKNKYKVWPNYDFQTAIMDGYYKVNYRLRSKEFEMRNELQRYIQKILGYSQSNIYEFARFTLKDVETSGRKIRELIQSGELLGWDDPSLVTLSALRKRGFQPEAIKNFLLNTGISKNEAVLSLNDLILENKRILDEQAKRLFFVKDPVKVKILNAPNKNISLNLNPNKKDGKRTIAINEEMFVSKLDLKSLKKGSIYRFIEAFNVKYLGNESFEFVDNDLNTYKESGRGMLHYLDDGIQVTIVHPDKSKSKGLAENHVEKIKKGEAVQFERFGFCAKVADKEFYFTHD